jgi:hypothetical protein
MRSSFRRFRKLALLLAALATALAAAPARADYSESRAASATSARATIGEAADARPYPGVDPFASSTRTRAPLLRLSPATSARYLVHCALLL